MSVFIVVWNKSSIMDGKYKSKKVLSSEVTFGNYVPKAFVTKDYVKKQDLSRS